MKILFKSKIDKGMLWFLIAVFFAIIATYIIIDIPWTLKVILLLPILPSIAIIVDFYMHTNYTIDGDTLIIKSGVLVNQRIDINGITAIDRSHSWLSSPALSSDRIRICYKKRSSVLISPERTDDFVKALIAVNPAIDCRGYFSA